MPQGAEPCDALACGRGGLRVDLRHRRRLLASPPASEGIPGGVGGARKKDGMLAGVAGRQELDTSTLHNERKDSKLEATPLPTCPTDVADSYAATSAKRDSELKNTKNPFCQQTDATHALGRPGIR